jgi:ribosomal protein S18 acetylase RimI-like enzyme
MDTVIFSAGTEGLRSDDLAGFFVGWPHPPSVDVRLEILRSTDEVATAITDHRFAAYIPLVEVLPGHQGRGIGSQMVTALLEHLRACYMIDLVCDDDVVPFYERLGGTRLNAVAWRNHARLDTADD